MVIQTDGGLRPGDGAAAAYIIGFWGRSGEKTIFEPLFVAGAFLDSSVTVLTCEAVALEEASAKLANLIDNIT